MLKRQPWYVVIWLALLTTYGLMAGSAGPLVHAAATEPSVPAGLAATPRPTSLPEFSLPTPTGTTIRSADLAGKVVVVRFWATW